MVKSIIFYIRFTLIITMALFIYPLIYVFGIIVAIPCGINPHKAGVRCLDKFNEVFE